MRYLLFAFLVSSAVNFLFAKLVKIKAFSDARQGVQKFHSRPVPRLGGVGVFIGALSAWLVLCIKRISNCEVFLWMILSSFPVVVAGILEDGTGKVSHKWRLLASLVSGLLVFTFGICVNRVGISLLDYVVSVHIVSLAFTSFAIAGICNAFNIIDGFNGLASGVAMLAFVSYSYLSFKLGDDLILFISAVMFFSLLGFFVWNYPYGLIFLGDAGAYFIGFMVGAVGILIVDRHSLVSPWFPVVLLAYPIWETLFSMYRRRIKGKSPFFPDAMHLHSIIFRRITGKSFLASVYCWFMELLCVVLALAFWKSTPLLMLSALAFVLFYLWIYFRIVRFKTPKILKV